MIWCIGEKSGRLTVDNSRNGFSWYIQFEEDSEVRQFAEDIAAELLTNAEGVCIAGHVLKRFEAIKMIAMIAGRINITFHCLQDMV